MRSHFFMSFLAIWALASAAGLTLHARSFWLAHDEPDERVYLALARRMTWTYSDYSTRDIPEIRSFPYSIYRGPLFHQPPLFPMILKVGDRLGNPVAFGLAFSSLSMALLLWFAWRWMVLTRMPPGWAAAGFAGLVACPLLLASTTLLHLDGLLGIYGCCGLVAYIEALEARSRGRAVAAGALLVAALNLRYNALLILPLIPVLQAYRLYRAREGDRRDDAPPGPGGRRPGVREVLGDPANWSAFAIVVAMVVILGLPHYARILGAYGTLRPGAFVVADPDAGARSDYMRLILQRRPWKMALLLLAIFPILAGFLAIGPYRPIASGLKAGAWAPVPLAIFLYLLPVEFAFSYQQMRHFAAEMPWLYLGLPFLLRSSTGATRVLLASLGATSLLLMITTGFLRTVVHPPDATEIIPSLFYYFPPLMRYYE